MQGTTARAAFIVIVLCAGASLFGLRPGGATAEGDISPATRAATFRFAATVTPADQAWIRAAVQSARPEARRLVDEIDGLVTVRTDLTGAESIGLATSGPEGMTVNFNLARLNGDRAIDRAVAVLHEFGHIVDWLLVDDELVRQLDAAIPPAGPCVEPSQDFGACTATQERFADTFAKWALRGRFSLAGSGYGIPTPPSLEAWGMPLSRLAYGLDASE